MKSVAYRRIRLRDSTVSAIQILLPLPEPLLRLDPRTNIDSPRRELTASRSRSKQALRLEQVLAFGLFQGFTGLGELKSPLVERFFAQRKHLLDFTALRAHFRSPS